MLNTHDYDGKINKCLSLESISTLSIDIKKEKCQQLLLEASRIFKTKSKSLALNYLKEIINSIGTPDNFDITNNINADDLIYLASNHLDNSDFMNNLELQLIDMHSGFCPQGRTHRLYQLLVAFDYETL